MVGEPGMCSAQELRAGRGLLIGQGLGVGQPGVIVESGVQEQIATSTGSGLVDPADGAAVDTVPAAVSGSGRASSHRRGRARRDGHVRSGGPVRRWRGHTRPGAAGGGGAGPDGPSRRRPAPGRRCAAARSCAHHAAVKPRPRRPDWCGEDCDADGWSGRSWPVHRRGGSARPSGRRWCGRPGTARRRGAGPSRRRRHTGPGAAGQSGSAGAPAVDHQRASSGFGVFRGDPHRTRRPSPVSRSSDGRAGLSPTCPDSTPSSPAHGRRQTMISLSGRGSANRPLGAASWSSARSSSSNVARPVPNSAGADSERE